MQHAENEEIEREEIENRKEMYVEPFMSIEIPDTAEKGKIQVNHQRITIEPGGEDIYHYHNETYDLFTIIEGEARLKTSDEEIKLQEGDSILVEPGDKHKVYNPTNNTTKIIETRLNVIENDFQTP